MKMLFKLKETNFAAGNFILVNSSQKLRFRAQVKKLENSMNFSGSNTILCCVDRKR